MRTTFHQLFYIVMIGALVLSSCNLPTKNATAEPTLQTEPASANVKAPIELTATSTEIVATESPTVTPTETPLSEPSATDTPEPVMAKVTRVTNCRTGPA